MKAARETGDRFEAELAGRNVSGARLGYLLSAVLMPAGFTLDFAMAPSHVGEFLVIRLLSALVALVLLAVSYAPVAIRRPVILAAGPPLVCGAGIEAMILRLEGADSPYYAGLNLCILAIGVLYTLHWRHALAISFAVMFLWLAPAVVEASQGRLHYREFFNNFYFIALTMVISVASTVIRFRSARREFDARAEVESTSVELAGTLERLRELDRMKNEFFANISHELRTPLTLILSPVEDLLSRNPPEQEKAALGIVRRNAQRLLRLIDDLLDLARLDAGGLRLRVAEVDLAEMARRIVDGAQPTALSRGISLTLDAPAQSPDLWGDPHRLEMILTNLVGNALKFTPEGGHVEVCVKDHGHEYELCVRDDGEGIASEDQERIFERFYQVEGSERRRHQGAGIGLALARELARLHDGDLVVESSPGQGALFRMRLPRGREHFRPEVLERRRVSKESHPQRRSSDSVRASFASIPDRAREVVTRDEEQPIRLDRGRRAKILVVEDETDLREFVERSLQGEFEVISAADGRQALDIVRADRPDLVLTDVMMPVVSGTDLCRTIKSDRSLKATPVIMLTARSGSDATLEGYSAGADDFVTKPFHTRVLLARIRAQLKLRAMSLQLADQAQLTTAGTLAAGIAHEVKNPLNAILNAARVLKRAGQSKKVSSEKLLNVVEEGAGRIMDIVAVLEEHVRPAEGVAASACDISEGIESSLRLLEHKIGDVTVHRDYGAGLRVLAPARQMNQVFLNLLDNALRAGPKNLWVRTARAPGGIRVSISDDGPGVDPQIVALIFEPFFTTRPAGEGTGLGLYLCRRIVDDCGGLVSYQPREGGGAEFVIELPAMEAAA
ncbi:MAG: response regulator [Myxococcales bacterium]|nr:response regulator [Myxococcales bacterium]MCB9579962.1 response regulator [Polyangiaceae bacterium]